MRESLIYPTGMSIETNRPAGLPEPVPQDEYPVELDTNAIKLDHILSRVHGSEAWFDANPSEDCFTYYSKQANPLRDESDAAFVVRRDRLGALKKCAFSVYEDMRAQGSFGRELADDIVASWRRPAEEICVFVEGLKR